MAVGANKQRRPNGTREAEQWYWLLIFARKTRKPEKAKVRQVDLFRFASPLRTTPRVARGLCLWIWFVLKVVQSHAIRFAGSLAQAGARGACGIAHQWAK